MSQGTCRITRSSQRIADTTPPRFALASVLEGTLMQGRRSHHRSMAGRLWRHLGGFVSNVRLTLLARGQMAERA